MQPNQPTDIFFDGIIHDSQFAYLFHQPDIHFWTHLAKTHGPRVLELACGTGRITIPIAEAGIAIDGVDFSEAMLRVARQRAAEKSLSIPFFQADIRHLPNDTFYNFIFLPSGTISHLLNQQDIESFLTNIRQILLPDGVIALDVHNPTNTFLSTLPLPEQPVRSSFQHKVTQETVLVDSFYNYASDTQLFTIKMNYIFSDYSVKEATIVLRAYFPCEIQSLLYYNGFTITKTHGDYDGNILQSNSQKHIILAKIAGR